MHPPGFEPSHVDEYVHRRSRLSYCLVPPAHLTLLRTLELLAPLTIHNTHRVSSERGARGPNAAVAQTIQTTGGPSAPGVDLIDEVAGPFEGSPMRLELSEPVVVDARVLEPGPDAVATGPWRSKSPT